MSKGSLRKRVYLGSAWTLAGFGLSRGVSFLGHIATVNLLMRDAFGTILLINAAILGLDMISDSGIALSVIQNKRGKDLDFLHTAWTIKITRGFMLWAASFPLGWVLAYSYDNQDLMYLLPVAAFSLVIGGFSSTAYFALNRELSLGRVTMMEIVGQLIGVTAMVAHAWFYRSVWSLVTGSLVASLAKSILSHIVNGGIRMRLRYDRSVAKELFHFGKWVFMSTLLTYLSVHGDKFIVASFVTVSEAGLYEVALKMVLMIRQIITRLNRVVLIPAYSRLADNGIENMLPKVIKSRIVLMAITLPMLWGLTILGQDVADLIYPVDFKDTGFLISLSAITLIPWVITSAQGSALYGVGASKEVMVLTATRTIAQIICMIIGSYYWGVPGLILSKGISIILIYPVSGYLLYRHKLWFPLLDLGGLLVSLAVIPAGMYLRSLIPYSFG